MNSTQRANLKAYRKELEREARRKARKVGDVKWYLRVKAQSNRGFTVTWR